MFLSLPNIMKSFALVILSFLLLSGNARAQTAMNDRYPNELPGYRFYSTAKWKSLEPLISTPADVRRVLGKPTSEVDLSQYFAPYPGDDSAKNPVFTYDIDDGWKALIYLAHSCFPGVPSLPAGRVCTIELIPKNRIAFDKIEFPTVFKKTRVAGADAAWDEFADSSGLSYHVYTTRTPYGDKQPGDLNRIVYGPSNESLAHYVSRSP